MANSSNTSNATAILSFAFLLLLFIFLAILPLGFASQWVPAPDIILATTLVWLIRKPEAVPLWLLAVGYLLVDIFLMRAPGLMTAAIILVSEFIKSRDEVTTEVPFAMEWSLASAMIAATYVGTSTVSVLVGAPAPLLVPLLLKVIATIAVYPLVVFVMRLVFGIERRRKSDGFGFGSRR